MSFFVSQMNRNHILLETMRIEHMREMDAFAERFSRMQTALRSLRRRLGSLEGEVLRTRMESLKRSKPEANGTAGDAALVTLLLARIRELEAEKSISGDGWVECEKK